VEGVEKGGKFYDRNWRFSGSLSIIEKDKKEVKERERKLCVFWVYYSII